MWRLYRNPGCSVVEGGKDYIFAHCIVILIIVFNFSSLSSIGPVGSAVCVYRAGVGINGGIYQTYTQDTLDFSEDPPIPRENKKFLCNTAAPRDDNIAMFRVESAANVHQMSADPILVLNGYK